MFDELLSQSRFALRSVDTYLSLPENRLARAAATRIDTSRARLTLPTSLTLIHGPSGVGKSHLALSALAAVHRRNPKLRFVCTTTQVICHVLRFANDQNSLAELLEQFQSLDVLICEDLECLEQDPAAQSLFVMLIETLEQGATRILLTSSKPIREIASLDQRLVSRCHGGLSVALPVLDVKSRFLLIQHWLKELKLPLAKSADSVSRFLAEQLPRSPRELLNSVRALAKHHSQKPVSIDIAYLERWLIKDTNTPRLSFETIVHVVAREFRVNETDIRSRSRQQRLALPRQCAMWLARKLTNRPLEQIGEYFDRSHTTVAHSLNRLEEQMPAIPALRQQVQKLRKQLKDLPREDCA